MSRTVYFAGIPLEIDDYESCHRPENQTFVRGVPVNPTLRVTFDCTPNEERDPLEIEDWWGRPFIQSYDFHVPDASYADYCQRMARYGAEAQESEAEYDARVEKQRREWFEAWPEGVRYNVRCLDGGAWDRSTNHGAFATLDAALDHALDLASQPPETWFVSDVSGKEIFYEGTLRQCEAWVKDAALEQPLVLVPSTTKEK